jgi:hypothetical protein
MVVVQPELVFLACCNFIGDELFIFCFGRDKRCIRTQWENSENLIEKAQLLEILSMMQLRDEFFPS